MPVCVCEGLVYAMACVWRSMGNLQELVIVYHMGPRDQFQAVQLGE